MVSARKKKLAIFISGRGSNMTAILDATQAPDYPAEIAVVLSNKADAAGLQTARDHGIATEHVSHKDYDSRTDFDMAMHERLQPYDIDMIVLAGFMRVLSPEFVALWPHKIINIHPSLLPDYKGLDTHARAIADGKSEAGCTVHYVVPALDSGEIIMQERVPIHPDDTADTLATRVLGVEHALYPAAIRALCST